ncbi:MAG TPA: chromate transporter [Candidatus Thermoplasmatota archaeon]|nr:chromate transporter [Candidatus Thermoplasmatota archaeon]
MSAASLYGSLLRLGFTAVGPREQRLQTLRGVALREGVVQDEAALSEGLAFAQRVPGPQTLAVAVWLGHRAGGLPGAMLAGACYALPGVLLTILFASMVLVYRSTAQWPGVLKGVGAAATALLLLTAWRTAGGAKATPPEVGVGLLTFGLVLVGAVLLGPSNPVEAGWTVNGRTLDADLALLGVALALVTPGLAILSLTTYVGYLFGGVGWALGVAAVALVPLLLPAVLASRWEAPLLESPGARASVRFFHAASAGVMTAAAYLLARAAFWSGEPWHGRWPFLVILFAFVAGLRFRREAATGLILVGGALLGFIAYAIFKA